MNVILLYLIACALSSLYIGIFHPGVDKWDFSIGVCSFYVEMFFTGWARGKPRKNGQHFWKMKKKFTQLVSIIPIYLVVSPCGNAGQIFQNQKSYLTYLPKSNWVQSQLGNELNHMRWIMNLTYGLASIFIIARQEEQMRKPNFLNCASE